VTELERKQAAIIEEQAQRIRLLEQKVDLLVRQIYGSKSEKLDPAQLELLLKDEAEAEPKKDEAPTAPSLENEGGDEAGAGTRRKNKAPRGPRIPEDLPVVEEVIEPEPVKGCPQAWRRIARIYCEDCKKSMLLPFSCIRLRPPGYAVTRGPLVLSVVP